MSEAIGAVGAAGAGPVARYDLAEFGALQRRAAPYAPGAGDASPVENLGQSLADRLKATSDDYRRAIEAAIDPLSKTALTGLRTDVAGRGVAPPAVGAPQPVAATELGQEAPFARETSLGPDRTNEVVAPREEAGRIGADGMGLTDQALEESVGLMLRAHSEIMKRQVGVMSATTTLEAATSTARSSGQNIDTLLRGA